MYIHELTESKLVSIRSIVGHVVRLQHKSELNVKERAWLDAIAANEEVTNLISRKISKGSFDMSSDHLSHHWLDDLAMYAEARNALSNIEQRLKLKKG